MITKHLTINEQVELLIPTKLFGIDSNYAIYEGWCDRHYFPGKRAVSFKLKGKDGLDRRISTVANGLGFSNQEGKKTVTIPLTQEYIISRESSSKNNLYELQRKIRSLAHQ